MTDILTALASMGTAAGALFIACQIWQNHRQSAIKFEDSFDREYRKIIRNIPIAAMFGEKLSEQEQKNHLADFYFYFDLCNEQAHYCEIGRIKKSTWEFWYDGMKSNFDRPAFKTAWREVCSRAEKDFSELRELFKP